MALAQPRSIPAWPKARGGEIFRNGLGLYSTLVIGGIAMNATQMLVIAIIMPTIVGASTGMVWSRLGARRAYTLGACVFALGTVCCALAPNIGSLIAARGVQGWAGGLVSGSGMALIASVFDSRLRTRIIAISQGTFTACHLSGPIVGGMFAATEWWRGSFWMMAPLMLIFAGVAHWKIPKQLSGETERSRFAGMPFPRFGTLAVGVISVAASGSVPGITERASLLRLDRRAADNLFPRGALSVNAPIGLALWILSLHGMTQTSVTLFLPLLHCDLHRVGMVGEA